MKRYIVYQKTDIVIAEISINKEIPRQGNVLILKEKNKKEVSRFQVVNVDFYYEDDLIKIRVLKF